MVVALDTSKFILQNFVDAVLKRKLGFARGGVCFLCVVGSKSSNGTEVSTPAAHKLWNTKTT